MVGRVVVADEHAGGRVDLADVPAAEELGLEARGHAAGLAAVAEDDAVAGADGDPAVLLLGDHPGGGLARAVGRGGGEGPAAQDDGDQHEVSDGVRHGRLMFAPSGRASSLVGRRTVKRLVLARRRLSTGRTGGYRPPTRDGPHRRTSSPALA